ncbi:VCBS domain-containing protein, partial [Stutzerimonas kirkiae]|uniref:VCBS domain-containing protein n=1 Tax=Stutzerimonas kirkiae TaxID=2211392 RepID=UPI0010D184C2
GKLTLTGFDVTSSVGGGAVPTLGELQFSYELENVQTTPADPLDPDVGRSNSETIGLKVIDGYGDEAVGNLVINIVDDVPVARNDANEIDENSPSVAGNVVTGQVPGDAADTQGADGAMVTGVVPGSVPAGSHVPDGNVSSTITGQYGSLTLNPDGSYTYTLDNDKPEVNALK